MKLVQSLFWNVDLEQILATSISEQTFICFRIWTTWILNAMKPSIEWHFYCYGPYLVLFVIVLVSLFPLCSYLSGRFVTLCSLSLETVSTLCCICFFTSLLLLFFNPQVGGSPSYITVGKGESSREIGWKGTEHCSSCIAMKAHLITIIVSNILFCFKDLTLCWSFAYVLCNSNEGENPSNL